VTGDQTVRPKHKRTTRTGIKRRLRDGIMSMTRKSWEEGDQDVRQTRAFLWRVKKKSIYEKGRKLSGGLVYGEV